MSKHLECTINIKRKGKYDICSKAIKKNPEL